MDTRKIALFLSLAMLVMPLCARAQQALLVAIDRYATGSRWNDIHATNDLDLITQMLVERGTSKPNIEILKNERATKSAIVEALQQLAKRSLRGENVYIHFSCHGQQMSDDNADEEDGLDEAIVPYDAAQRYSQGLYEGENHLRDDELMGYLERIRQKVGSSGYVVLIVDACHSGTINRQSDIKSYKRGTTYIFAREGYSSPSDSHRSTKPQKMFRLAAKPSLSPITVIAACGADEINYEYKEPASGKYYGALSFALSKILATDEALSAAQLYKKIDEQMAEMFAKRKKRQTPYIETTNETQRCPIGR